MKFKEFILKLKAIYLKEDIIDLWEKFERLDKNTAKLLELLFMKKNIQELLKGEKIPTVSSSIVLGSDVVKSLLSSIDYEKNIDEFKNAPLIFKNMVIHDGPDKINEFLISKEENTIKPILHDLYYLGIFTSNKLDLINVVRRWFDIWDKPLDQRIVQFSKPNTMKLFYHNLKRFFDIETNLNIDLFNKQLSSKPVFPANKDVFGLLKAIITGEKQFASRNILRYFRNKDDYERIVILVFDGLGYIFLRWGSYFIPELKNLLRNENNYTLLQSEYPTLTGVNHCALLAGERLYEDAFFHRIGGAFEKDGKKYKTYRVQGNQEFKMISDIFDLFSFEEDNLFISAHTGGRSFLSNIIGKNANGTKVAKQYTGAIKEAFRSNNRLVIAQVNIFDQFLERYDPSRTPTIENIHEFWEFDLELISTSIETIKRNIKPKTLTIIVADHGLNWIKSENIIRPVEILGRIAEENFEKAVLKKDYGDNVSYFRLMWPNGDPIVLFIPVTGPRRIASLFIQNKNYEEQILNTLKSFSREYFTPVRIRKPRDFDPNILLISPNHMFYTQQSIGKYFVGKHGGISIHESIVPLIIFDDNDMTLK